MNFDQLSKSNITNLTNLWKLMGYRSLTSRSNKTMHASLSWPYRIWFDLRNPFELAETFSIGEHMKENSAGFILPLWNVNNHDSMKFLFDIGLYSVFKQTCMVLNIKNGNLTTPSRLNFHEVQTVDEVSIFTNIASRAFNYYIHEPVIQSLLTSPQITMVITFHNTVPVGVGMLYNDSNVAGLHLIGVLHNYRRKGIAKEITLFLLNKAREMELDNAVLQASALGEPLYSQLGFSKQFSFHNFSNLTPEKWLNR